MSGNDDKKLKLLVVASHEGFGFVHVDKLFPSLIKMGCDITFIGWDRKKKLPNRFLRKQVHHHMVFRGWGFANRLLMVALPLWVLKSLTVLIGQRGKFDLIMAIDFDSALPVALSQMVGGLPFIYNIRDNFSMRTTLPKQLRPVISFFDRWILKRSVRIIVPDENRITGTCQSVMDKFVVIYNCATDVSLRRREVTKNPFTIYAMGYLLKVRGIELLLKAAARLPEIRFLFAGVVHENDIENQIQSLPNVDFRGWLPQKDALELCFESDVIFAFYDPVSEINRKAASNKWSDAMMASKPLLVNNEVQKSSWIQKEDFGYLCPYGDVHQLVQIIQYIREHPEEARLKGQNGRHLYEAGYSWDAMENRLGALLEEMRGALPLN